MAFDPGLHSAQAAGVPVTRGPYPEGAPGIRMSLEVMAQKIREGRVDPAIIGWAGQVCKDAGLDGRDRSTTAYKQGAALLDAVRAVAIYAPDAYGAEVIQSAAGTLCLRPNLCLNRGDCDDLSVALGAAAMSLGIPVNIVKQTFGAGAQEHVLVALYDGNEWLYADPSTKMAFGQAIQAESEVWIDPMEAIGPLPAAAAEIVTLGKPMTHQGPRRFRKLSAPPSQHWPVGAGSVLGYPTISDLQSLVQSARYNLTQLQAYQTACSGWTDTAGWTQWQSDLTQLATDVASNETYVTAYIGDQPSWLYDWSIVFYPWNTTTELIDREIDLDRQARATGTCTPPEYPNEPQPSSFDPDLWTYNATGSILKGVSNVASNATSPVAIGAVGLVAGMAATVGVYLAIQKWWPRKR